jgi:hypothetical protein
MGWRSNLKMDEDNLEIDLTPNLPLPHTPPYVGKGMEEEED